VKVDLQNWEKSGNFARYFQGFNKNRTMKSAYIRQLLMGLLLLLSAVCLPAQSQIRTEADSLMRDYFGREDIAVTEGNSVTLLASGHDKFVDLFEQVRQAKHHIHLEYFNFRNDSIANALFDLLAEKAAEGVEVRALFDAFGNSSNNQPLKKKHLKAIRERGVQIVKFDPFRFPYINHALHRDHRKIVVIDGRVGYTGGMNIAQYYIEGLPEIGPWRDMHARIEGPAVDDLQQIFVTMWRKATKEVIEGKAYFPYRYGLSEKLTSAECADSLEDIAIVDRRPHKTPKAIRRAYIAALDAAQRKVQLVNPYFVPSHSIMKALRRTLKRGVEVEIMIPAKSDIPFTPAAARYQAYQLYKKGAEVYVFNGGFHHSKIMMVDSTFCTVGSANLNSRSLRYDYEVNAFVMSPRTTGQLIRMYEKDKLNSDVMDKAFYKSQPKRKRLYNWFAHLFTPFL
jgi:cardiolipin synthase